MHPGVIGGILGGVVGFLSGAVGTYFSIKNAGGRLERRCMIKAAAVMWVAIAVFLGLLLLLPAPYRWFLWIPYGILLPLAIVYSNKRQDTIRRQEADARERAAHTGS